VLQALPPSSGTYLNVKQHSCIANYNKGKGLIAISVVTGLIAELLVVEYISYLHLTALIFLRVCLVTRYSMLKNHDLLTFILID